MRRVASASPSVQGLLRCFRRDWAGGAREARCRRLRRAHRPLPPAAAGGTRPRRRRGLGGEQAWAPPASCGPRVPGPAAVCPVERCCVPHRPPRRAPSFLIRNFLSSRGLRGSVGADVGQADARAQPCSSCLRSELDRLDWAAELGPSPWLQPGEMWLRLTPRRLSGVGAASGGRNHGRVAQEQVCAQPHGPAAAGAAGDGCFREVVQGRVVMSVAGVTRACHLVIQVLCSAF